MRHGDRSLEVGVYSLYGDWLYSLEEGTLRHGDRSLEVGVYSLQGDWLYSLEEGTLRQGDRYYVLTRIYWTGGFVERSYIQEGEHRRLHRANLPSDT